jgi:hypothetical protein
MRRKISREGVSKSGLAEYISAAFSGALLAAGFIVIAADYFGLV